MKKIIKGKKYNFLVYSFKSGKYFCFYIEAKHKRSLRHSFINNVNCILSGLDITDINDKKMPESQWIVTEKESRDFFIKANDFLIDGNFRNYIEKQLDLDRELGEWNKL